MDWPKESWKCGVLCPQPHRGCYMGLSCRRRTRVLGSQSAAWASGTLLQLREGTISGGTWGGATKPGLRPRGDLWEGRDHRTPQLWPKDHPQPIFPQRPVNFPFFSHLLSREPGDSLFELSFPTGLGLLALSARTVFVTSPETRSHPPNQVVTVKYPLQGRGLKSSPKHPPTAAKQPGEAPPTGSGQVDRTHCFLGPIEGFEPRRGHGICQRRGRLVPRHP